MSSDIDKRSFEAFRGSCAGVGFGVAMIAMGVYVLRYVPLPFLVMGFKGVVALVFSIVMTGAGAFLIFHAGFLSNDETSGERDDEL